MLIEVVEVVRGFFPLEVEPTAHFLLCLVSENLDLLLGLENALELLLDLLGVDQLVDRLLRPSFGLGSGRV